MAQACFVAKTKFKWQEADCRFIFGYRNLSSQSTEHRLPSFLEFKFQATLLLRFSDKGLWTCNLFYLFFFFLVLKYPCKYAGQASPGYLCEGAWWLWIGREIFQILQSTVLKSIWILSKRKKSHSSLLQVTKVPPSARAGRGRLPGNLDLWSRTQGEARWDASFTSESRCCPGHRNVVASLEKCR